MKTKVFIFSALFLCLLATFPVEPALANDPPTITGQSTLTTPEETDLTITLADLTVDDPDNTYPIGFTLTVQDGTNYTRTSNTITPDTDFNGTLTVPVTVNDGAADSDIYNLSVSVTAVNDPPVITGQSALSTPEETDLAITLADLIVDDPDNTYPTGFTLTVQDGTNYTRTGNTITPATDFNSTLTVPVTVNDGVADSDVFNLSVSVTAANDPPVITDQATLTTPEETDLTITLADLTVTDPDNSYPTGFTLTVQDGTNYTHTGNTITPATDFNGTLTVPVTVNDGVADSDVFNLSVSVTAVNDPPVITDQATLTTPEETDLTITLADLTVTDPDNSYPTGFTLTVQDGTNYTHTGNTITPATDFNGTLTVPVTVNDGVADSDVFNLSVSVTAANDPPVITDQATLTTPEETDLTITLADLTVTDPDNSYPTGFTLTVQDGTNYTHTGNTITPATDFNGTLTVPVTVNDGVADSDVFNLSVSVTAANDPPVITDQATLTTPEETDLTITLADLTVTDPDNSYPTGFTLTVQDGTNYTHTGNTITPATDFNGTLTVPVTVNDGVADSDVFNLSVSVTAVNDPPVVSDIPDQTIDEGQTFTTITLDNFVDDETPDAQIVWTASGNVELGLSIVDRVATITIPDPDWNGAETITFTATDLDGGAASDQATFTVTAVNDAPVANDDAYTTDEDAPLPIAAPDGVLGNDTDPDVGDLLTATLDSGPTNGTLTLNSDGSFTYTPNTDFSGTDSFTYFANDVTSNSNLVATVTITVNPVNDLPTANDDAYTTDEDTPLTVADPGVLENDTDPDVGDLLTATLDSGPSNGTLTLNSDGSFTYKPNLNYNGFDSFTYRANDGTADSDDVATVSITVNPVVDPPIADAGPDQTVGEGRNVILGGSNSFDTEGETLSYQWEQIGGASSVTLSNPQAANPTFTAPSTVGSGGESLTFQLTVTDEEAAQVTDTAIVNVTVPLANRPPNANAGGDQQVEEGEPEVTLNGSNSFDPDGDSLSFQWDQISGPPVTLMPDSTAENPIFTAPLVALAGLSFTFELTVTDTSGLQATDTTVVNVTSSKILQSPNQPPAAVVGDDPADDQEVDEDAKVTLNGSNSSDPEGTLFYRWRQVAGRPVTLSDPAAKQPTFTAPNVGDVGVSLKLELTVTDLGGLQAVDDTLVNVRGDNDFPVSDAGDDQTVGENTPVTLDGLGSFDPEGENLSYSWVQVVGPSVTLSDPANEQPSFTAPNVTPNGVSIIFELTVTDVVGLQQRDYVEISALGLNDQPIADAGDDQTVLEKTAVTLDASNSSDPDVDDIMTYQWNQTGGKAVTLSDPTSKLPTFETPNFEDAVGQPLIFELIVTDGQGEQSQEDSTTVTVSNFEKKNPGASGGGCFITTASYGSSMDSHHILLREFRDRFLKIKSLGGGFLKLNPNVE